MFGTVRLYQKGSMANVLISSNVYPQDRNTRLTLGSVRNTKGLYASNFKVLETKLSDEEIQKNGNLSFRKARRFYCLHDDKLQRENCLKKYGKAHKSSLIFIIICFFLSFTTTSLTAILSVHFKAASDQQITFVPGEVNKHLTFEIINNSNKGSKTFQVIFSNPQRSVLI
ncbi:unnamed protein product, partial [Pocillopora meandrina]